MTAREKYILSGRHILRYSHFAADEAFCAASGYKPCELFCLNSGFQAILEHIRIEYFVLNALPCEYVQLYLAAHSRASRALRLAGNFACSHAGERVHPGSGVAVWYRMLEITSGVEADGFAHFVQIEYHKTDCTADDYAAFQQVGVLRLCECAHVEYALHLRQPVRKLYSSFDHSRLPPQPYTIISQKLLLLHFSLQTRIMFYH